MERLLNRKKEKERGDGKAGKGTPPSDTADTGEQLVQDLDEDFFDDDLVLSQDYH